MWSRKYSVFCAVLGLIVLLHLCAHVEALPKIGKRPRQEDSFRSDLEDLKRNIYFRFYDKNANVRHTSTSENNDDFKRAECDIKTEKLAIIAHGWRQDCNEEWVKDLVKNLVKHRGGCIVCVDYGHYTRESYYRLFKNFNNITTVLVNKLKSFQTQGFDPQRGYMFGFSFGGQMVLQATKFLQGSNKFKDIDICDMAGPGFDRRVDVVNFRSAAENVQCIHTSRSYGTHFANGCHQNWKMGNCGVTQNAGEDNNAPFGSHGLCPIFYNIAFEKDFLAVAKPDACYKKNESSYSIKYPEGFKMGYTEERKRNVFGDLYAYTTEAYPYVAAPNETVRIKSKRVNTIELHIHRSNLEFKNDSIILYT